MVKRRRGSRTARAAAPRATALRDAGRSGARRDPDAVRGRARRGRDRHRGRAVARAAPRERPRTRRHALRPVRGRPAHRLGRRLGRRSRTGSRSSACRSRRTSPDPDDLADEVWVTVVHELAHHLGIDDERLARARRRLTRRASVAASAIVTTDRATPAGHRDDPEPEHRAGQPRGSGRRRADATTSGRGRRPAGRGRARSWRG